MNKFTVAIIVVILAAFGGLVGYSVYNKNNQNKPLDVSDVNTGVVIEGEERNGYIGDHVRGKADSKIVVVEYADYQCPGCASMAPHLDKIYEEYKTDVAFVFRNFPLKSHQNARAASAAAEAAGKQGYFWEMYDSIYSNRNSWIEQTGDARTNTFAELFAGVAKDGDVAQFRKDLSDENIIKKIDFDYAVGLERDQVKATPSIYIDGEELDVTSVQTFDEVEDLIREKLDAKIAEVELKINVLKEEGAAITKELELDAALNQKKITTEQQIAVLTEEYAQWKRLCDPFGNADGSLFQKIAQSFILGNLLHSANSYLKSLHPRYSLEVIPGTLHMSLVDAYQGYATRFVTTLSGGESFLVSLSLALALADIGQNLAVDILFIDEGFGTLSGSELNNAINALRALHRANGRRVGIISHVAAVKESVPVQIRVIQEGHQSSSVVKVE